MVYDAMTHSRVFRAEIKDATYQVTRLFYVQEFIDDKDYDEAIDEGLKRF